MMKYFELLVFIFAVTFDLQVCIEVLDVNDNVPQTSEATYYPRVLENSAVHTPVVQITATDLDSPAEDGSQVGIQRKRQNMNRKNPTRLLHC
jgi:hypothetical protein